MIVNFLVWCEYILLGNCRLEPKIQLQGTKIKNEGKVFNKIDDWKLKHYKEQPNSLNDKCIPDFNTPPLKKCLTNETDFQ